MDAFSFSISIGTFNIEKKDVLSLTLLIGLFHLIMPMLGFCFGIIFKRLFSINFGFVTGLIFLFITLEMIKDFKKEEEINLSTLGKIILALSVSIDSFAVGFALGCSIYNALIYSLVFSLFSASFTFLGLQIGKKINSHIGTYSKVLGIAIMLALAVTSFVKS